MLGVGGKNQRIENLRSEIRDGKDEVKIIVFIVGLAIAAAGGVIAYRALFLEPSSAVLVTETGVRELPNTLRMVGGIAMLIVGACLAFFGVRRGRQ